jgi:23S rRNA (cytosine1962-C5)-methyltransferase
VNIQDPQPAGGKAAFASVLVSRKPSRRLHPWVFSNEVHQVDREPGTGDVVAVFERGRRIGNAIYSPHSLIRARLFTAENRDLDGTVFVERIAAACALRRRLLPAEQDYRLVYGESDGLPGLTIDKYGNHFVVQAYAVGMEQRLEQVTAALRDLFPVESVYAKNDTSLRELEGLPRYERLLCGSVPDTIMLADNGARFNADIKSGQKTGFYFDQRLNRARIRALSAGKSVLDLFCYSGGFAVNAALGGATSVLAVDSSARASELVRANAEMNDAGERVQAVSGDAFDVLRQLNSEGRRFDLIVVDPPSFAKSLRDKARAIRGYRDINLQAMKLLSAEGFLLSCTCSHHITWSDLAEVLTQASQACGRSFRIVERVGQGPDHPVLLHMPESDYLRSYLLQLI